MPGFCGTRCRAPSCPERPKAEAVAGAAAVAAAIATKRAPARRRSRPESARMARCPPESRSEKRRAGRAGRRGNAETAATSELREGRRRGGRGASRHRREAPEGRRRESCCRSGRHRGRCRAHGDGEPGLAPPAAAPVPVAEVVGTRRRGGAGLCDHPGRGGHWSPPTPRRRPNCPKVEPFRLDADQLCDRRDGRSGVDRPDAAKIQAAQEALAREPKPVHVPREPRPVVLVDDGPLVLVETRAICRSTSCRSRRRPGTDRRRPRPAAPIALRQPLQRELVGGVGIRSSQASGGV